MTRLSLLAPCVFAGALLAQDPAVQPLPPKPVVIVDQKAAEAKAGEAAKPLDAQPQEKSAQDVINPLSELQRSIERKTTELEATKKLAAAGGMPTAIRTFFTDRTLQVRSVEVQIKAVPIEAQPQAAAGSVRLMTADEKASLGENVVALVEGQSITKAEVDEMVKYYGQNPGDRSEDDVKRQALQALIVQKAALGHYQAAAPGALSKLQAVEKELADGGDFAELAKKHSMCPSAAQGGDLDFFGRRAMDPIFEKAAFTLKMGEVSPIIQTSFGYHLVKNTGFKKGENPGTDQVRASHILVMFDTDANAARQVSSNANQGHVNLAFRDDDWQKLNPFAR